MNVEKMHRDRYKELVQDIQASGGRIVIGGNGAKFSLMNRNGYTFHLNDMKMWIRIADKWCRYCGIGDAETVDHVIPKAKGGLNSRRNMVGCCVICNERKRDLFPKEAGMLLHVPPRWFGLATGM